MTADTILVDGTDLQTTARIIQTWGGVHALPEQRGSGYVVPGRHGVVDDIDRPFAANTLSRGMLLRGGAPDVTGFNDAFRALELLVKPGRKVTLTRRLTFTTGTEDHTQSARCLPFTPEMLTPADGKFVLNFLLLDGLWSGASVSTSPGTRTITGETVTRRISITVAGAGTLANTTTGVSLVIPGAATIDVLNKTTTGSLTGLAASGDPLGSWFTLAPGSNVITWSGSGTPTITYYPAYL
jgi:hypothetical protein